MPAIASLTDFNRNQNEIVAQLHESGQPLYLTRNGKASVVVMDAEAFDAAMSFRTEMREREMRVCNGILRGYEEALDGKVTEAREGLARIRAAKGWES